MKPSSEIEDIARVRWLKAGGFEIAEGSYEFTVEAILEWPDKKFEDDK